MKKLVLILSVVMATSVYAAESCSDTESKSEVPHVCHGV